MSSTGTSWNSTLTFLRIDASVRSRRSTPSSRRLLTAPLDPATAKRVKAAPRTTLSRRTVLLVTHDPLAVAEADRFVTLEVGVVRMVEPVARTAERPAARAHEAVA